MQINTELRITGPDEAIDRLVRDFRLQLQTGPRAFWVAQPQLKREIAEKCGVRCDCFFAMWADGGGLGLYFVSLDSWGAHGGTVARYIAKTYQEVAVTITLEVDEDRELCNLPYPIRPGKHRPEPSLYFATVVVFQNGLWSARYSCHLSYRGRYAAISYGGLVHREEYFGQLFEQVVASGSYDSFTDEGVMLWEHERAIKQQIRHQWEIKKALEFKALSVLVQETTGELPGLLSDEELREYLPGHDGDVDYWHSMEEEPDEPIP